LNTLLQRQRELEVTQVIDNEVSISIRAAAEGSNRSGATAQYHACLYSFIGRRNRFGLLLDFLDDTVKSIDDVIATFICPRWLVICQPRRPAAPERVSAFAGGIGK